MKLLTQILLSIFIIAKIVLGSVFIYQVELDPLATSRDAMASEPQKDDKGQVKTDEKPIKESNLDLNFLLKKQSELEEKEKSLSKRKAELMAIQEEINAKIATLTQLRNEIRTEMERKKVVEDQKIKHLIKVYSAMKPQNAASLIEKLDTGFAVELLSKMKGDEAGGILSFVNVEKAARISEGLVSRR